MLSVSVMDSEEGYLQFAGFNGGLFELLPDEPGGRRRFDLDRYTQGFF